MMPTNPDAGPRVAFPPDVLDRLFGRDFGATVPAQEGAREQICAIADERTSLKDMVHMMHFELGISVKTIMLCVDLPDHVIDDVIQEEYWKRYMAPKDAA